VNQLTSFLALAQVRLIDVFAKIREREEGQGTAEYAVLVVAVIAMAAAIVGVITGGLTTYITNAIAAL
jgi:hypothetical protein